MPFLEILHYTGDLERRDLNKRTPLSIGSHASNDLLIDEEEVELLHCRISWAKDGFEAVAAGTSPLDVNGTPVQRAMLKAGDVLRFGSVDVRFRESENDGADRQASPASNQELGLKPITSEMNRPVTSGRDAAHPPATPPASATPRKRSSAAEAGPGDRPAPRKPMDMAAALDALAAESLGEMPVSRPRVKTAESEAPQSRSAEPSPAAELIDSDDFIPDEESDEGDDDGMSDRLRTALRSQQRRPGEEDPLRSPLVLSLLGGATALILTGAIFYFIASRQTTQQAFNAAKQLYDEGKFTPAIQKLQEFSLSHPKSKLATEANRLTGLARVRQQIEGAAPKYPLGLEKLRAFIDEQKDLEGFESQHPDIMAHAKTISLGAAIAAGKQFDRELLEISRQARTLLRTYAPKDAAPTETLDQIEQALRTSTDAILRDDVFKQALADINAALKKKQPLEALKLRRDLLVRYPNFERDKQVVALMEKTLAAEKAAAIPSEIDQAAETTDHDWPADSLSLVSSSQTRSDEAEVGKGVVGLSQDCCYGLEFVTGRPLWRRVIGFDTPFFPLQEESLPSVILFDTVHQELVRLNRNTGQLVWRQPLEEDVVGEPLLTHDAIYLSTSSGRLLAVEMQTGRLVAQLAFSQPIGGPIELPDEQRMVVAGSEEVLYTVTKRPFACETISYLGQAPDSVQAPLLAMASYLLMIENETRQATLRLLKIGEPGQPLTQIATGRVAGRVVDPPVLRGRDLFVPSTGERVSAFSLSDDPGQPPLTAGPVYQAEGQQPGPIYLMTGPDRQVWMATSSLSQLRLTTNSLQPDGQPVAPGLATQPLQYISGYLFNARRRPYTSAVTMTRTDRDQMVSDWQAVLGGEPLAVAARAGNALNLAVVTGSGQVYRVSERQFSEGRFLSEATFHLPLNPDLAEPLVGGLVGGDRLAVACGGPEPRLWIINIAGQTEGSPLLPSPPQGAPAAIGNAIVVPLAGRVHVIRPSGQSPVQEFSLPSAEQRAWVSVTPISNSAAAAVTKDGLVLLLRIEESPRPHLGEVARVDLGHVVVLHPAAADGLFAVADNSQRVSVFDAQRLEPRGQRTFTERLSSSPAIAGGKVFVEEGRSQVHCLNPGGDLDVLWSLPLENSSLTGVLARGNEFVIAQQQGTVLTVQGADGTVVGQFECGSPLALGPFAAGGKTFVVTVDGTLIKLP